MDIALPNPLPAPVIAIRFLGNIYSTFSESGPTHGSGSPNNMNGEGFKVSQFHFRHPTAMKSLSLILRISSRIE
jgi:hypothetical protein